MKKWIAVLVAVVLASIPTACSLGKNKREEKPPVSSSSTQSSDKAQEEKSSGKPAQDENPSPAETAQLAFMAIKELDLDRLAAVVDGKMQTAQLEGESARLAGLLVEHLDCRFGGTEINGETALVKADITNTDLSATFHSLLPSALLMVAQNPNMTQKEMADTLLTKLADQLEKDPGGKTVTVQVDLPLKRVEGKWKMVVNEAVIDALAGGVLSEVQGLTKQFGIEVPGVSE